MSEDDINNQVIKIKEFQKKNCKNSNNIFQYENNSRNDDIADFSLFSKKENKLNSSLKKEELYRYAERLFYSLIENNKEFIKEKLNISCISKYTWLNIEKELFEPYDFIINENIYIDVKCTEEKKPTFYLSSNEYEFMNNCDKNGNKYFVANIVNVNSKSNRKWEFFDSDEIKKLRCTEKTERKFFKE